MKNLQWRKKIWISFLFQTQEKSSYEVSKKTSWFILSLFSLNYQVFRVNVRRLQDQCKCALVFHYCVSNILQHQKVILKMSLRKKCPYSEFFCFAFFYLEILRISPYSVHIWKNKDQKNSEYNTYHGVCNGVITRYFLPLFGFSYTFHFSLFFLSFYFFVVSLVK